MGALTLGIHMETNRTTVSRAHPSLNRQADRWVRANLRSLMSSLTVDLYHGDRWELRFDADGGTYVLRGKLGTNEIATTFEPNAESRVTESHQAA